MFYKTGKVRVEGNLEFRNLNLHSRIIDYEGLVNLRDERHYVYMFANENFGLLCIMMGVRE